MDATYVLDSSSYARRFTQRACALSENLEEVELALAELDFAPNRVPAITPGGLHRLLVWRGRILQLDRDFEQSQPSDFNIRLCIFLTDCLVLAKMSDAFSSTTGPSHKAKVTGVISFYKMEVVSTPNIGAFRNIVNLIFDEKSSLPVSFSSSVEKGEFLSKLTVKESSPQPAKYVNDRLAEDIRNKKTVPLFDDIEAVEIDASTDADTELLDLPTDAEIDKILERADSISKETKDLIAQSPLLRGAKSNHFIDVPNDKEVTELLEMAKNVEGLLDMISPAKMNQMDSRLVNRPSLSKANTQELITPMPKSPSKVVFTETSLTIQPPPTKTKSLEVAVPTGSRQPSVSKVAGSSTPNITLKEREYQKPWRHNSVSFSNQTLEVEGQRSRTPSNVSQASSQPKYRDRQLSAREDPISRALSPQPTSSALRSISPSPARKSYSHPARHDGDTSELESMKTPTRPASKSKPGWKTSPNTSKPVWNKASATQNSSINKVANDNHAVSPRNKQPLHSSIKKEGHTARSPSVSFDDLSKQDDDLRGRNMERRSLPGPGPKATSPSYMRPTVASSTRSISGGSLSSLERGSIQDVFYDSEDRKEAGQKSVASELAVSPKSQKPIKPKPTIYRDVCVQTTTPFVQSIGVQTSPPRSRTPSVEVYSHAPIVKRYPPKSETRNIKSKGYAAPTTASASHSRGQSVTISGPSAFAPPRIPQRTGSEVSNTPYLIKKVPQMEVIIPARSRTNSTASSTLFKPTAASLQRSRASSSAQSTNQVELSIRQRAGQPLASQPKTKAKTPQARDPQTANYKVQKPRSISMDASSTGVVGKYVVTGAGRNEGYRAPTASSQFHTDILDAKERSLENISGDLQRHARSTSNGSGGSGGSNYFYVHSRSGSDAVPRSSRRRTGSGIPVYDYFRKDSLAATR